ncbi:hypothetical protein BDA99DRAFT_505466 [Phascolomyces articulosus]|uniref:FAD-binding domain-containing protein n=1 Tax=Phascolomyces articulosus TaxID=60185 RepID=A0AAD5PHM2_9FUNG|nr:hypothetical protein BDA99DRAFT_505466 [Phascolomyces articulosus]
MRIPENKAKERGKSINLALSERGLSALRATDLGLDKIILKASVPMHARMVHVGDKQMSQAYSVNGEHINAVDRARLNDLLLDAAEKFENVTIYFDHRLNMIDFDKNVMTIQTGAGDNITTVKHYADLIVGADGAYSRTRGQMMRRMRMDYEQIYIDTGYCELSMPPLIDEQGQAQFALDPNHLHIWPRHTFMLIALPNPDRTFTCTLFMPFEMFDQITTEEKLMDLFTTYFPDAIPLIGQSRLIRDYFTNPRGSLISVKSSPHHLDGRSVIIGDAAHAMVPFYGQGMNCGFEDIEVLHQVLDRHGITPVTTKNQRKLLEKALTDYSNTRVKDAHAICDLAMYNHYEMRSAVTSYRYLARKKIEGWIHLMAPRLVVPLYTMVSFSTLPYSKAIERWHKQNFWLNVVLGTTGLATLTGLTGLLLSKQHNRDIIHSVIESVWKIFK